MMDSPKTAVAAATVSGNNCEFKRSKLSRAREEEVVSGLVFAALTTNLSFMLSAR